MKKISYLAAAVLALIIMIPMISTADDAKKPEKIFVTDVANQICPVMGTPADKDRVVIVGAKLIHICCNYCVKELAENPGKYMDKIAEGPKESQKTYELVGNEKCPVSGKPVDKNVFAIKGDKIYYFCCPDCRDKFNPAVEEVKSEKK